MAYISYNIWIIKNQNKKEIKINRITIITKSKSRRRIICNLSRNNNRLNKDSPIVTGKFKRLVWLRGRQCPKLCFRVSLTVFPRQRATNMSKAIQKQISGSTSIYNNWKKINNRHMATMEPSHSLTVS